MDALRAREATSPLPPTPAETFESRALREQLGAAGLRVRSLHSYRDGGVRRLEAAAEFSDLAELRRSPLRGGQAEWRFERGREPNTIRAIMYPRGEAAWRAGRDQVRRLGDVVTREESEMFARAKAELDGMILHWTFEMPGSVIAHSRNLRRVDDRRVEAVVTTTDVRSMRELIQHTAPRFEVIFDGQDCTFALDPEPAAPDATR